MVSAAYYPVNDTSRSLAERAYLQELTDLAANQPLEEDSRQEVRTLTIIFTIIAIIVVALRFISRLKIKAPFWVDDWLILAALVLLFGNSAFNFVMVDQGVGLHSGRLTLQQLQDLNKVRGNPTLRRDSYLTFVVDCCWSRDHLPDRSKCLQNISPVPLLPDFPDQVRPNVGIRVRGAVHMLECCRRVRRCLPVYATGQDLGAMGGWILHQYLPGATTRLGSQYFVRRRHIVPAASPRPSSEDQLDAEGIPGLHVHARVLRRLHEHLSLHGVPGVQSKGHSIHAGCPCGVERNRDKQWDRILVSPNLSTSLHPPRSDLQH